MEQSEIAQKWMEYVDADLELAEKLFEQPHSDRSWQIIVFHCHEAVEKALKAVLVYQGKEVKKIHNLWRLYTLLGVSMSDDILDYLKELDPHYPIPRYPDLPSLGPSFTYSREIAGYHVSNTRKTILWIKEHLLI